MAEDRKDTGVIQLPPQPQPTNPLFDLLSNKRVKDLVFDIAEKQIKEAAGIETSSKKVNNKTPFGRTASTIKDFIQGTWWAVLLLYIGIKMSSLVVAIIGKWAGV